MKLHAIVAMTTSRVIGKDNDLPWKLPSDLKRFKQLTMGHPIIMGRKTFESIGRLLPGRENIILSRSKDYEVEGATVLNSLQDAHAHCKKNGEQKAFIIGGAGLFKTCLDQIDVFHITWIDQDFPGDTYFPNFNFAQLKITHQESHTTPFPHRFIDYTH